MVEYRGPTDLAPDRIATGFRVGFLGGFERAYREQALSTSLLGLQREMQTISDQQAQQLQALGVNNVPSLGDVLLGEGNFEGLIDELDNGTAPEDVRARLDAYDRRIAELRDTVPNLRLLSSREIAQRAAQSAREAEDFSAGAQTSLLGDVGYIAGGIAGSLNPYVNPLFAGVAAAGLAGGGIGVAGSALARVGIAAVAEGATEGANLALGGLRNRRAAGLSADAAYAATQIGTAAIFGGVFQGVGEGLTFAGRRYFTDVGDLVPAVPDVPAQVARDATAALSREAALQADSPLAQAAELGLGATRQAVERLRQDLTSLTSALDSWDGGSIPDVVRDAARRIRAQAIEAVQGGANARALAGEIQGAAARSGPGLLDPEAAARVIDPETFTQLDALRRQQGALERALRNSVSPEGIDIREALTRNTELLEAETAQATIARSRAARDRAEERLRALQEERQTLLQRAQAAQVGPVRSLNSQLAAVREARARLAPLVQRALARATDEFVASAETRALTASLLRDTADAVRRAAPSDPVPLGSAARVGGGQAAAQSRANVDTPGAGVGARQTQVAEAAARSDGVSAAAESLRAFVRSSLDTGQDGTLPPVIRDEAELDAPTGEGTTIRQQLAELEDAERVRLAVNTCRM